MRLNESLDLEVFKVFIHELFSKYYTPFSKRKSKSKFVIVERTIKPVVFNVKPATKQNDEEDGRFVVMEYDDLLARTHVNKKEVSHNVIMSESKTTNSVLLE